jgi:hypothetical protein
MQTAKKLSAFYGNKMPITLTGQVPTAASMEKAVFWVVAPYNLVVYRYFRAVCCFHHQSPDNGSNKHI